MKLLRRNEDEEKREIARREKDAALKMSNRRIENRVLDVIGSPELTFPEDDASVTCVYGVVRITDDGQYVYGDLNV